MPPKKGKSGKNSKSSNTTRKTNDTFTLAEDMEEYAKVIKCLGDRKLLVVLTDNSQMMALIPGRFKKKIWMKIGDIVLVSRRDFQDDKLDVINKYEQHDIKKLHKLGVIPDFFLDFGKIIDDDPQGDIHFNDEDDIDHTKEKDNTLDQKYHEEDLPSGEESNSDESINIDDL